ncbi:amidohydrolase [Luteimicrobium subarcticum]|uniref:Hippurate hydrolase n=1 Tax=Luteimicrobium subarcticum TaxID=620910 RepID=A0A2M8WJL4_9MICO|nr:amidohydrolase [Luteimicrobium subarcticum]PJI91127.1 hippurate hydrolase [Luteimicrobium subarcticum]
MTALTSDELTALYTDLHAHPEIAFQEHRTAGIVAGRLRGLGYDVHEGIGGTGVAAVLARGDGPTVLLRADMDGLPVTERTGLPYASTDTAVTPEGTESGTMHACGHDVHTTCLLGAAAALADDDAWSGTLVLVFQPAEEVGAGARAMVDDGLYDTVPTPDVVLGQHVMPFPVGVVNLTVGTAMAAADSLRITLHGKGGHGSMPESTVDPVLMAAATVQRLQGIVSREVGATQAAVVTVGALRAGTQANIIPDRAELLVNVRTFDQAVRTKVLGSIRRIVEAEATASGAPEPPELEDIATFNLTVNDPDASARTTAALQRTLDAQRAAITAAGGAPTIIDIGPAAGSEDVCDLATAAGVPLVYWNLGGFSPALFAGFDPAAAQGGGFRLPDGVAPNHSPFFAPVAQPTLDLGVALLVDAAREWLG